MTRPLNEADERLIEAAIARMRAGVMAIVFALVCGTGLFLATAWLLMRGGPNVGQTLGLLRHYFPGYSVTWPGSLLGFLYGALVGGIVGGLVAWIYNRVAGRGERRSPRARNGSPSAG
jgi:hypothetical protein